MSASEAGMEDHIALVTGGGRGIGAATARLLADQGCRVAVLSRSAAELEAVIETIHSRNGAGRAIALVGDVSLEADVADAFERILGSWGPVNILINNAGTVCQAPIQKLTLESWERTFAVNVRGAFLCSRQAFIQMKGSGKGGSIVNISSLGGLRHTEKFPGFSAYTASKHAVVGLTEALAAEGRPCGIRVNCVAPGAVDTRMLHESAPFLKTKTPPEDIARLIAYLCDTSKSRPLTGSVIEVNCNE